MKDPLSRLSRSSAKINGVVVATARFSFNDGAQFRR